jgi:hypothetical protein
LTEQFSDLPLIRSEDEARRVHRTAGEFFVKRGGVAHSEMTCGHLDWTDLVDNPAWRVATDSECRASHRVVLELLLGVLVYAVVDDSLSSTFPLGDALDVYVRREDAERFIEEVRGDDPEFAKPLRIEERELEAAGFRRSRQPHRSGSSLRTDRVPLARARGVTAFGSLAPACA